MYPSQLEFLKHIQDECLYILRVTSEKSKESVVEDETLSRAIIRSLEIIGEATKKLSDEFRASYPHVEWRKMAATRDVMIHDYFGIDYDIVWSIITDKLSELEHQISTIIKEKE